MSSENNYYFSALNKEQKQVYHVIYTGLSQALPSFTVPMLSSGELTDIFTLVRLDHPEIFYSPSFTCSYYQGAGSMEMRPEYLFKGKQLEEQRTALKARTEKLVRPVLDKSEREKELFIHDFILAHVHYDKLKKAYSHEITGPLTNGVGVCEGIAKTVKLLCDRLGLWCIVALCSNNPDKGIKYRHMWNVLKLDGKYCHLDATFDLSLSRDGQNRYDYFNIDDTQLYRDHEPVIFSIPPCTDKKGSYYIQNKLSFTKYEDVSKRVLQAAKKKRPFVFNWRGSYLTREVISELCAVIYDAANSAGAQTSLSLNWPGAVFSLSFSPAQSGETGTGDELHLEDANEGEMYDGE